MNKNFTSKIIIFFIFLIITVSMYVLSSHFADNRVNDFMIKILTVVQNKKSSEDVVLIAVDDKSLKQISWPWRRDLFADIFDFLENKAGAKAIVFDNLILFPDTYYPESDTVFNQILKKQKRVINSYILFNSSVSGDVLPEEYIELFDSKSKVTIKDKRTNIKFPSYSGVINMPKEFLQSVSNLASAVIPEDRDEIVRNYMPVVLFDDKPYPSLALSAYSMYSGINEFVLTNDFLCSADNCKSLKVPVTFKKSRDYIGNVVYGVYTYFDWYKPTQSFYTHKVYSAIDVLISAYNLQDGETPRISPEQFKDKVVVIGLNADKNVWERLSETPVLKKQADIDVHATMISNMINNSFKITEENNLHVIILTLIFCLFITRGFKNLKSNLIYTSAFALLYFLYYLYEYFHNIYLPPFSPIVAMYFTAILKKIYNIISTDKYSELIKRAMGKYVSKDVMKKVVSNLEQLNVGGIRTEVTVLFVDIRDFTTISENLPPQEVSSVLNDYFSVVEPIIEKYNGVINKYLGDGLLAVFGEPVKSDNHALEAIKCANEILTQVKILKEKFILQNKPEINIGIGINTGEVFAGNIGTDERLEYTVIGDNVNLASRIESYNHMLKTQFLISEYTYNYVKDFVDVVKLSQVTIKGKAKPIDIYEVLGLNRNV